MTFEVPHNNRVDVTVCKAWGWPVEFATDPTYGNNGVFLLNAPIPDRKMKIRKRLKLLCIASDGMFWEHVSVSLRIKGGEIPKWRARTPSWDEMCFVKAAFWGPGDRVIQMHPPRSEYVNAHEHCLHLWRPNAEHPVLRHEIWDASRLWPVQEMVGPVQPEVIIDDSAART